LNVKRHHSLLAAGLHNSESSMAKLST